MPQPVFTHDPITLTAGGPKPGTAGAVHEAKLAAAARELNAAHQKYEATVLEIRAEYEANRRLEWEAYTTDREASAKAHAASFMERARRKPDGRAL